jgi:hypothetical protein
VVGISLCVSFFFLLLLSFYSFFFSFSFSFFFSFFFFLCWKTSLSYGPSDPPLQSKPQSCVLHPRKFPYTKLVKLLAFH